MACTGLETGCIGYPNKSIAERCTMAPAFQRISPSYCFSSKSSLTLSTTVRRVCRWRERVDRFSCPGAQAVSSLASCTAHLRRNEPRTTERSMLSQSAGPLYWKPCGGGKRPSADRRDVSVLAWQLVLSDVFDFSVGRFVATLSLREGRYKGQNDRSTTAAEGSAHRHCLPMHMWHGVRASFQLASQTMKEVDV